LTLRRCSGNISIAEQDAPVSDYVLISRHVVEITIGGVTKSYPQKKKGKRLTRAYVAYMFCQAQGWPLQKGDKWVVFNRNIFKLLAPTE
jgi:hypothetical protein